MNQQEIRSLIESYGCVYSERDGRIYANERFVTLISVVSQFSSEVMRERIEAVCTDTEPSSRYEAQEWEV